MLSNLGQTWIFDLDGTIVVHNGYLSGKDTLLDGAKEFFHNIPLEDKVIIITARSSEYKEMTINFLKENEIRFDTILFDMPKGERILINDIKPRGLKCGIAINTNRDEFLKDNFIREEK